jgi:hypothetical protein
MDFRGTDLMPDVRGHAKGKEKGDGSPSMWS